MENLKNNLRRQLLQRRQGLNPKRRQEASSKLKKHFCQYPGLILSYCGFNDELETDELNKHLTLSKALVLPRMEGQDLLFFRVKSIQDLRLNRYGILEPRPEFCNRISPAELSAALIPGLGFDKAGNRLGYGKGYYDRCLVSFPKSLHTFGIGFQEQLSHEALPFEPHDIKLHSIHLF